VPTLLGTAWRERSAPLNRREGPTGSKDSTATLLPPSHHRAATAWDDATCTKDRCHRRSGSQEGRSRQHHASRLPLSTGARAVPGADHRPERRRRHTRTPTRIGDVTDQRKALSQSELEQNLLLRTQLGYGFIATLGRKRCR
jgi:hypothetical protein